MNPHNVTHRLSVAPMMDWTHRHCRYWHRLLSPQAKLYTEMITVDAICHGNIEKLLAYDSSEHPVALQLGGSDPVAFQKAIKLAEPFAYDEININVGCPSPRVKQGRFGACLFKEPLLVADCVRAMREVTNIPITIKTRIGVDEFDHYDHCANFIAQTAASGCEVFIMHARKAWLNGLSPVENRTIPPLNYAVIQQLMRDFPSLTFILNGGITQFTEALRLLEIFPGIMLGRAAYHQPYLLHQLDNALFASENLTREALLTRYLDYVIQQTALGVKKHALMNPILGIYHACQHGKQFRRILGSATNMPLAEVLSTILHS